jgi:hypothetical protein
MAHFRQEYEAPLQWAEFLYPPGPFSGLYVGNALWRGQSMGHRETMTRYDEAIEGRT